MVKAGKDTIKYINKQNILNSFKGEDVLSKADLLERTKLSAATVSSLIQELVQDGLLLENRFGESSGGRSMAYVLCDNGVGLSVITRGKLFRADNCGMELGHTVVDLHGERCKCSAVGCVGTLLGEQPALRRYAQICRQEDGGLMPDLCRLSYDDLVTQSLEGDAPASQVIAEQLDILSVTLTNVINLFNPEVLVLGGPLSRLPSIEHAFAGQLKARSLKPFAQNLSVVASRQGLDAALGGMAHFVLDRKIFKSVKI